MKRQEHQPTTPLRVLAESRTPFSPRVNPYISLLHQSLARSECEIVPYSRLEHLRANCHIIHSHWPEYAVIDPASWLRSALRVAAFLIANRLAKARGVGIVWTAHNIRSHVTSHPKLTRWFLQRFVGQIDGLMLLSTAGFDTVLAKYPQLAGIPMTITRHGVYSDAYKAPPAGNMARHSLGIKSNHTVITHFGGLFSYKRVDLLARSFRSLAVRDATLLVAGHPHDLDLAHQLTELAQSDSRIILRLERIRDTDVPLIIGATDVVVLPYEHLLNSGVALLALTFGVPVLGPETGALIDLRDDVGAEWVGFLRAGLEGDIARQAYDFATMRRPKPPSLDEYQWDKIAGNVVELYRRVLLQ